VDEILCFVDNFVFPSYTQLIRSFNFEAVLLYLPMQKLLKISPSRSSAVNLPVISSKANWARRSDSAASSPADWVVKALWAEMISF
jgi:hypothetical protein